MMHPSDLPWWKTHSADYVLGLLTNAERLVFERILPIEPELQEYVVDWREKLQPMADAVPSIQPPDHILPALIANIPVTTYKDSAKDHSSTMDDSSELDHSSTLDNSSADYHSSTLDNSSVENHSATQDNSAAVGTALVVSSAMATTASGADAYDDAEATDEHAVGQSHEQTSVDKNHHLNPGASPEVLADGTAFMGMVERKQTDIDRWRGFAGLATAACLLVGIFGWMGIQKSQADKAEPTFDGISIVQNSDAQPVWVIDASAADKKLRVTAVAPPALDEGQVFELWMVKPNGGMVSLGLLPTQTNASTQINTHLYQADAESFNVSVESVGGSPESIPSGPVLYQGLIQTLNK